MEKSSTGMETGSFCLAPRCRPAAPARCPSHSRPDLHHFTEPILAPNAPKSMPCHFLSSNKSQPLGMGS